MWIAPGEVRDERELLRTRMAFSKMRAALKNRMHATLAKYALSLDTDSDIFAAKWRGELTKLISAFPAETERCMQQELELLDLVQDQINLMEKRILERTQWTVTIQMVKTVPGVGKVLSIVIEREVGTIDRFASVKNFSSYCGTTPKVKGSGGKFYYGKMIKQCNNYLKWAFIEAANVVVLKRHHPSWRNKYVVRLYERVRQRKGHAVAVGAVARYLSEATYWVLKKGEPYREPKPRNPLPKQEQARA